LEEPISEAFLLGHKATPGRRVRKDRRVLKALKENRVTRDLQGRKELPGHKAHKARLAPRDQLEWGW
jgi:hypothetical protein